MSMNMCLKQASEIELARFARDGIEPEELMAESLEVTPAALERLRQGLAAMKPPSGNPQVAQAWNDMATRLEAMSAKAKAGGAKAGPPSLNLHKSWHVLHYLFTGRAWDGPLPAATLLKGGREVGDDLGYGPARSLSPQETKAFAQFLAVQSPNTLVERIDTADMQKQGIYCAEMADDDTLDELEGDVEHYFPQLQTYVGAAAKDGRGLLIWLS